MASSIMCFLSSVNKGIIGNAGCSQIYAVKLPKYLRKYQHARYLKTEALDAALIEKASTGLEEEVDDEVMLKKEEELERKRNKSRLQPQHRNILHGKVPYSEPMAWYHETVKYKRKLYGRYGQYSGVLPGIMWPTKEELEETKEYESVAYPYSIHELMAKVEQKKKEEELSLRTREEEILKKYAKLEQWKTEVRNNAAKKLAAAEAAKAKKDRLVEEVRRHFGYTIDPRDERFKEMLEQKEKEERKMAKDAKKKARYEATLAKLKAQMQIKVEGTESTEASDEPKKPEGT